VDGEIMMAEQVEKVRCPFCEGRGELSRTEIAERLTTPELRKRLDARIAEIVESVEVAGVGAKGHDFQLTARQGPPSV